MPSFTSEYTRRLAPSTHDYHAAYGLTVDGDPRPAPPMYHASATQVVSTHPHAGRSRYEWYTGLAALTSSNTSFDLKSAAAPPPAAAMAYPNYDIIRPSAWDPYLELHGPDMVMGMITHDTTQPIVPAHQTKMSLQPSPPPPPHYRLRPETVVRPPVQEEKHVGGVSAHLDYDMKMMAEYVADITHRIIQLNRHLTPVTSAYRKWVEGILVSTRLPSATILLALYYMAMRVTGLATLGQYEIASADPYRMLAISLVLGSKFLDDSTFQNRSWAEVCGMDLGELNALERQWLLGLRWSLFVDPCKDDQYQLLTEHWRDWVARRLAQSLAPPPSVGPRLPPFDHHHCQGLGFISAGLYRRESAPGMVHRGASHVNTTHAAAATAAAGTMLDHQIHYGPPAQAYPQGNWGYPRGPVEYSPPSAPESGPATPDHAGYPSGWYVHHPAGYQHRQAYQARPTMHPRAQDPRELLPPSYAPPMTHAHGTWGGHPIGCRCAYCCGSQLIAG